MTAAKNHHRLLIVLATVLFGAAASTLLQVFVLEEETPLFQSAGRLVVESPFPSGTGQAQVDDFCDSVIETLESEELKRRAITQVFARFPGLIAFEVRTLVSRNKNGSVFKVTATSADAEAAPVFLDALLEEFIAFRLAGQDLGQEKPNSIGIQNHASPAARVHGDWVESALSGTLSGGAGGFFAGLLLAFVLVRPVQESASGVQETAAAKMQSQGAAVIANHRLLLWGLALGIVAGSLIQIIRLTSRAQEFRSLAKVVAVQGLDPARMTNDSSNQDYYGTIIETLESSQTRAAAMRRVKALNPESKSLDVDIRVAQTRGSAIFNVLATSSEPKYTRVFLDALLDEFMLTRTREAEGAGLDPKKDVIIQERATPASENVEDWGMPLLLGVINGAGVGGMLGFLSKLLLRSRRKTRDAADLLV